MDRKEQNRLILSLIKFEWDTEYIKSKFGEIPTGVDYSQSILEVLRQIQDEKGVYFQTRQEINRAIKEKKAIETDLALNIPADYNVKSAEALNLSELFSDLERARRHNADVSTAKMTVETVEGKEREIEAQYQIDLSAIEKASTADKSRIEKDIENLKAEIKAKEVEMINIAERIKTAQEKADLKKQASLSKFSEAIKFAQEKSKEFLVIIFTKLSSASFE
jgi:hypothetical protein